MHCIKQQAWRPALQQAAGTAVQKTNAVHAPRCRWPTQCMQRAPEAHGKGLGSDGHLVLQQGAVQLPGAVPHSQHHSGGGDGGAVCGEKRGWE